MDSNRLRCIAQELCDLLQAQMDLLTNREFADLTDAEQEAYRQRKRQILALREELARLVKMA